jgi:anti-sigma factor RsiW
VITCEQLINQFLLEYVEGSLAASAVRDFNAHLDVCPSCRAFLDSYRATARMAQSAGLPAPSQPVPEALVRAILKARGEAI